MKKIAILLALLLLTPALTAQEGVAVSIRNGTSNPGSCSESGRNIFLNRNTNVLAICVTGVWTDLTVGGITQAAADLRYLQLAGGTMTGSALGKAGTAGSVSWGFVGESDTGMFLSAANSIGFATGGTERWVINASGAFNCATDGGCDIGNGAADPRDLSLKRNLLLRGATSGVITVHAPAIAGAADITLPDASSVLPIFGQQITVTGPTAARTWTVRDAAITLLDGSTGATDNAALRADGTGGSTAQSSGLIISDTVWLSGDAGKCYVATDQTNDTTTMASSTCTISGLLTSTKYRFTCTLFTSNSVGAEGAKIDFSGGSATSTNFRAYTVVNDDGTGQVNQVMTSNITTDVLSNSSMTSGAFLVSGSFEPSGAGTFIPMFAEESHVTGTLTLHRGSNCQMWVMP